MRSSIAYVVCILLLHSVVVRASPVQGTAPGDGKERRGRDLESNDEEDVKKERGTAHVSLQAALERRRVDECLLVSLANGRLVALDKDSGELLWTFDTGGPLVSSNINGQQDDSGTEKGEQQGQESGEKAIAFPNEGIFPGTDGSLYTYQGGFDGGAPRIHRLPVGIRELVDASPSPAPDGTMLLGTQQSIVFVLDVANGNVLQTIRGDEVGAKTSAFMSDPESLFENYDDIYEDNDGQILDSIGDIDVDRSESRGKRRVFITIGRKDYVIKAIHPAFGEQWNVSYGSLQRLSSLDVRRSGEGDLHVEVAGHHHGGPDQTDGKGHAYHFRVGADNSLGRYDLVGRKRMWISKFDAPPLVAYPPYGDPIDLLATTSFENGKDDATDAMTSSNTDFQESVASVVDVDAGADSQHFRHKITDASAGGQLNSKNGVSQKQEETLVIGFMGGGLYGMRASPSLLTYRSEDTCASSAEDDVDTLTRRASSLVPHTQSPHHMSKTQQETVSKRENSASSTALVVRNTADLFTIPLWQKAVCSSSNDGVCAVPFGLFPVEQDTCENSQLVFLPEAPAKPRGPLLPHRGDAQSLLLQGTRFLRRHISLFSGSAVDTTASFDEIDFLIMLIGLLMAWASLLVVVRVFHRRTKTSIPPKAALKETAAHAIRSDPGHQKDESNGITSMPEQLLEDGNTIRDGIISTTSNDETIESLRERGRDPLRNSSSERRMLSDGSFRVGRLRVGPKVLGYGSGGTVVFEGQLDGRSVAVKRLLRQFVDLAKKEIEALIDSDEHPNVVRCFAMEEDAEFVYLALERCVCTLADVVSIRLRHDRSLRSEEGFDEAGTSEGVRPSLGAPQMGLDLPEEWCLVIKDGGPTRWALQIAENVGRGLAALHARGIVHRDVKPHNVLLTKSGQAKLSDMGLSKRLVPEQASFETAGGAGGSPGWQAPEQLTVRAGGQGRLTAAVDVFSFGLLTYYCLTGGKHPFGEGYERDAAILRGQRNLDGLQEGEQSEARDLVVAALAPAPEDRPPMDAVLGHPLWWPIDRRLSFLIDVSDTVEGEDRVEDSVLYVALEVLSKLAIGKDGEGIWSTRLDAELLSNLGEFGVVSSALDSEFVGTRVHVFVFITQRNI